MGLALCVFQLSDSFSPGSEDKPRLQKQGLERRARYRMSRLLASFEQFFRR